MRSCIYKREDWTNEELFLTEVHVLENCGALIQMLNSRGTIFGACEWHHSLLLFLKSVFNAG